MNPYTILDKAGNARKQRSAEGVEGRKTRELDLDEDEGQVSDGEEDEEEEETEVALFSVFFEVMPGWLRCDIAFVHMGGTCRQLRADPVAFGRWCMRQAPVEHGATASDPALAAGESGQVHRPVEPQPQRPDGDGMCRGTVEQQQQQGAIASVDADDGAPAAKTRKSQAQASEIVVGAEESDDGSEGAESVVSESPTPSTTSVAVEAGIEFKGVRCASVALVLQLHQVMQK